MDRITLFIITIFLYDFSYSQNYGIGTIYPSKSKLEQNAGSSFNLSNAIFGDFNKGISFQQNPPTIGYNHYIDNSGINYPSKWMFNGYSLKEQFNVSSGNMTWYQIREGVEDNIIVPLDEKIGMQLKYNSINNNGGLGVNKTPLTTLHVLYKDPNNAGLGAGFSPYGMVGFESNIDAFVNVMSPVGFQNGLLMGSPINAIRGGILYSHSSNINNESLALRTGGNFNRMVINAFGNVGLGDFTASNKLDIDGGVSLLSQDIDFNTMTYFANAGSWEIYTLNVTNRSNVRIVNSPSSCCAFIGSITPGTKIGQIITIELVGEIGGYYELVNPTTNIIIPNSAILAGPGARTSFIWNGTKWLTFSHIYNN